MNIDDICDWLRKGLRLLLSIPSRIRSIPPTILLPWPMSWFQQELKRIYFVEWALASLVVGIHKGEAFDCELIATSVMGGLIMMSFGNRLIKLTLNLAMRIGKNLKLPGTGFATSLLDLFFGLIVAGNYRLIRRFSVKKIVPDPWKKLTGKGRWKI